jgi:acetolactate synthase-1/2/3 large subunit
MRSISRATRRFQASYSAACPLMPQGLETNPARDNNPGVHLGQTAKGLRMSTNTNVAFRLAESFARHGVTVTFGQSLPSAFHLAAPHVGIRQAAYRQENAGGAMADGYARISGRVGVVTAQNGPAATLLVAPLAEALKASIPVVALVQEVSRNTTDRNAFQELDHLNMFAPVAKWVRRIDRADRLEDYVDMAFVAAASGRPGPVVILVPADLLVENAAAPAPRQARLGIYPLDRVLADPAAIEQAADLLAAARHPVVVAGGGVHLSGAHLELAALQEAAHLPVATTTMGKGVADETHPLTMGVVGYVMGRGARTSGMRAILDRADLVLLIGNRTNQNGTDSWKLFPPGARFIHLDADPMEVGRNYESHRLVGDAKLTLAALRVAIEKRDLSARKAGRPAMEAEIAAAVREWRALTADLRGRDGGPVRPERVMAELDRRLSAEDIAVADASYASIWIVGGLTARRAGQRFLTPRGIAGLGWGLPMAIGAQMAAPTRRVVCLCGDGGFGHSWAELETLRRLNLPITVMVLNNGILGYQKHAEDVTFGQHTDAVEFTAVDHAAIARACGVTGVRVERGEDAGPALDAAFASGKPALLDIVTDPEARPPISFYAGHYPEPF